MAKNLSKKILTVLMICSLFFLNGCFITDWYDKQFGNDEEGDELRQDEEVVIKTEDGDYNVTVEIADTAAERIAGLMGRESLPDDHGMLFVFDDERVRAFWMKDTILYLDLIFISADKKVVDIKEDFEPCYDGDNCPDYRSRREAKYVIEVMGGTVAEKGIRVGDEVEFEL